MHRSPRPPSPDLRQGWQIEQGARCGCRGVDDMCPCQNEQRNAPTPITAPEVCGLDLGKLEEVARAATQGDWGMSGVRGRLEGNSVHTIYAGPKQENIAAVFFNERTGDGFSDAKFIGLCKPETTLRLISDLRAANTALLREQLRASVLLGALRAVVAMEPEPFPFDHVAWGAEVDACSECQRYQGHPIQAGICDAHRRPLWARDGHDKHEQQAMHWRMRDLAREAIASVEAA